MNYESRATAGGAPHLEFDGELPPRRSRRLRWIIIGVVVLAAALGAWFVLGGKGEDGKGAAGKDGAGAADAQIPTISYVVPGRGAVERVVSGTGSLAARRELPVGEAGEGGLVRAVLVEAGQWVGAGQVLATVDRSVQTQSADALEAQIRVTQADLELAEAELRRAQQLVDRGFISRADIDRRTATRDAARARVRVAQAQLAETRARNVQLDIRAPARGLVLSRSVEPGQIVSRGSGVLFRIAKDGEIEMQVQLSQADLARVRVGSSAEVTPAGSTQSFAGRVWQVSPIIDPQTRQGIARVTVPYDRALRPGGFATARIVVGSTSAPLLPESAVLSDDKGNFVYLLDRKDEAVRRAVTVGEVSDSGVSIASGLDGTERVVLSAGAFLTPGQKVKPVAVKPEAEAGR